MQLKHYTIVIALLGVTPSAQANEDDFKAACSATNAAGKAVVVERCIAEQSEAFSKLQALKERGHEQIINQCIAVDRKASAIVGQARSFTDWRRVEACTRAYL